MLTQKNLDEIEKLTRNIVKEEIKHLPTKDEFYESMGKVMGELKAIREEQEVSTGKLSEHSDTLEDHETRLCKIEKVLEIPSN